MRNWTLLSLFVVVGLGFGSAPAAGQDGDPEAGRNLAERWCSRCHDIGPDVRFKQEPPGFAAIAVYRTQLQVLDRILAPHAGMPQVIPILDGDDLDDVISYILSLDPGGQ